MNQLLHVSSSPHIKDKVTTSSIMLDVVIALLPATFFGIYQFKIKALLIILTTIITCVLSEYIYEYFMKKTITIKDLSAVVTGLILALNLPATVPLWIPMIGGIFAIIVVKQLYGGLGQNFMNPALVARCFLLISFAGRMTNFVFDGLTSPTPLVVLKNGQSYELLKMFLGTTSGTIGETSTFALLIGAGYLLIKGIIKVTIPLTYLIIFSIFTLFFSPCSFDFYYLACELCGGGLIFGAFFMATDYVTSPMDRKGQIVYGIILGILTGLFRFFGTSSEGVSYAIIKDVFILCLITIICGGLMGYVYQITKKPIEKQAKQTQQEAYKLVMKKATSFKKYEVQKIKKLSKQLKNNENNVEIVQALKAYQNKKNIGEIIQVIDHDGFGGDIELIVGINQQKEITGVEILSIDETVGLGMNAKNKEFRDQYKGKKVDRFEVVKTGKQSDEEIDSLSGATITSKAMTSGINGALEFYDLLKGR